MTAPRRRQRTRLTNRQIQAEVNRELDAIRASIDRTPEPRCRICPDPEARQRVNRLLAYGLKLTEIEDLVGDINDRRAKNNKITYYSIRNHSERHFNVQDPASAAFRRIMERRQAQLADEAASASGSLLTGMAYLDIVARKGFERLLDETTVVDYEVGLKAQLKLEEMQRDGAADEHIAQMRRDVSILQQAVKDVVPANLMAEIASRIDELKGTTRDDYVEAELVEDDEDDDVGHDPVLSADANDTLGED